LYFEIYYSANDFIYVPDYEPKRLGRNLHTLVLCPSSNNELKGGARGLRPRSKVATSVPGMFPWKHWEPSFCRVGNLSVWINIFETNVFKSYFKYRL